MIIVGILGLIAITIPIVLLLTKAKNPSFMVILSFTSCVGAVSLMIYKLFNSLAISNDYTAEGSIELIMMSAIAFIIITMILDVIVLVQKIRK